MLTVENRCVMVVHVKSQITGGDLISYVGHLRSGWDPAQFNP